MSVPSPADMEISHDDCGCAVAPAASTRWRQALKELSDAVLIGHARFENMLHRFLCSLMPVAPTVSPRITESTSSSAPTLHGDALLRECGQHVPRNVLRNVSIRSMHLSLASGEAHREAALLWQIATLRGAVLPNRFGAPTNSTVVSERVAVQRIRQLIGQGDWVHACAIVHQCVMTDVGLAAGIHAYCAGQQWAVAAELMSLMSRRSWTDFDLSMILGAIYKVAKRRPAVTTSHYNSCRLWQTSLFLLDTFRREKQEIQLQQHRLGVPSSPTFASPSAVSNVLGILGLHKRWEHALLVAQSCFTGLAPCDTSTVPPGPTPPCGFSTVQPNVVALAQLCYALHAQWHVALSAASALIGNGSVRMDALDAVALQRMLNVCVYGQRWIEAIRLLQGLTRLRDPSVKQREARGAQETHSSNATVQDDTPHDVPPSHAVLGQDLCFRLLHLFGRNGATYPTQAALVNHHLSKHSNPNIVARSWNAMIQHADTTQDALVWQQKLAAHGFLEESESIARLVQLSSREGRWLTALQACTTLLTERSQRKHGSFIVTPELHDWTQYALSAAPAPGPSWEVSVQLFSKMACAEVRLTEISFQAVVRRCFTQGAGAQANAMFTLMMRRGVGRR